MKKAESHPDEVLAWLQTNEETVGLSMSRLQIRLFGPYFGSFLTHSYGYEPAIEPKSVLKHPNFRFGPHSSITS